MIASMGELLVEFVCTERDTRHHRPAPYVGPFPSGAPGIFIDQVARIRGRALFAGAVGGDAFGRVVTDRLAADGVLPDLIRIDPALPTGTAHVGYNADGSRDFVFNIAASAAARLPALDEIAAAFLRHGVTLMHVSGSALGDPVMRTAILQVASFCAAQGIDISIDPNLRPELVRDEDYMPAVQRLIAAATYVLPSDADAEILWPGQDLAGFAAPLLAASAQVVALKRGDRGASATDGRRTVDLPAHGVTPVDPTGAGDCFCATFVALHQRDGDLGAALAWANAAGALAVQSLGPMEGNPEPGRIAAFLAATP